MTGESLILRYLFEDEDELIPYKIQGVGTGHSKTGQRKKWNKRYFFEMDLFGKELREVGRFAFTNKFAGCSPDDVLYIWRKIRQHVIRPRETEVHARNKLLLWLDKLHNDLSWNQVSVRYQIGVATAIEYVNKDILKGMINAYEGSDVVSFQNQQQRLRMVALNKQMQKKMAHALYTMDGKHARCKGSHIDVRMSHKYKFKACFNCLFVIERTFGTVCAYNLDECATKHDLTILRESWWYQKLFESIDGWIILADKGYEGVDYPNIAPALRRTTKRRKLWPKSFWNNMNGARSDSERVFAHFFVNKFKQLANWHGKGPNAFRNWALNVTCGVIIYNELKLKNVKVV